MRRGAKTKMIGVVEAGQKLDGIEAVGADGRQARRATALMSRVRPCRAHRWPASRRDRQVRTGRHPNNRTRYAGEAPRCAVASLGRSSSNSATANSAILARRRLRQLESTSGTVSDPHAPFFADRVLPQVDDLKKRNEAVDSRRIRLWHVRNWVKRSLPLRIRKSF